jgi:hypothetical protein
MVQKLLLEQLGQQLEGLSNTNTIITVQGATASIYAAGLARAFNS